MLYNCKKLQIIYKQNYNQKFHINDIKEQIVIRFKFLKVDVLTERCIGIIVLLMTASSLF